MGWWENQYGNQLRISGTATFAFGLLTAMSGAQLLFLQDNAGGQLRLRAIVSRSNSEKDISKRASLLRTDSVHGVFTGTVKEDFENKALIINGRTVNMIAAKSPDTINYTDYGIQDALVIDNTGVFRNKEACLLYTSPSPRD